MVCSDQSNPDCQEWTTHSSLIDLLNDLAQQLDHLELNPQTPDHNLAAGPKCTSHPRPKIAGSRHPATTQRWLHDKLWQKNGWMALLSSILSSSNRWEISMDLQNQSSCIQLRHNQQMTADKPRVMIRSAFQNPTSNRPCRRSRNMSHTFWSSDVALCAKISQWCCNVYSSFEFQCKCKGIMDVRPGKSRSTMVLHEEKCHVAQKSIFLIETPVEWLTGRLQTESWLNTKISIVNLKVTDLRSFKEETC